MREVEDRPGILGLQLWDLECINSSLASVSSSEKWTLPRI